MVMGRIVSKTPLKDKYLKIIGWLLVDDKGNQQLNEFSGKIIGFYDAGRNCTLEFSGKIVAYSNILTTLLHV